MKEQFYISIRNIPLEQIYKYRNKKKLRRSVFHYKMSLDYIRKNVLLVTKYKFVQTQLNIFFRCETINKLIIIIVKSKYTKHINIT